MNGTDLLAQYRETQADGPFGELVRRYTNLVYSVAKRRVWDLALAQEVAQLVFIRLAKAVPKFHSDAELVAWLHRTTVHVSIDLWRSESRRRLREEKAAAMQPDRTENDSWNEIAPTLDEALNGLEEKDRQALLLRFFEQKTMRDLGLALGVSEDAAKMRVSRALDRLRTQLGTLGVTCAVAALTTLLSERSVEAAPSQLAAGLASRRFAARAGAGAGTGLLGLVLQVSKGKLALVSAALVVGAVLFLAHLLSNPTRGPKSQNGQSIGLTQGTNPGAQAAATSGAETNGLEAQAQPDPVKLLEGIEQARLRIVTGSMEFQVSHVELRGSRASTNVVRVKTLFDGEKRRVESFSREYAYTAVGEDETKAQEAKMRAQGLDQEEAVRAGLLKAFASHHVTVYDGTSVMDYCETSDSDHPSAEISDPRKGFGGYLFDPHCLGITTILSLYPGGSVGWWLGLSGPESASLVGEETVDGVLAWHIRVPPAGQRWGTRDIWVDAAHPVRVLQFGWNGDTTTSTYDPSSAEDPFPTAITTVSYRHGHPITQQSVARTKTQLGIEVDPASFTLAGLGMKVGTDVCDDRISRGIGYWTGSGLSENLPCKTAKSQPPPNRTELMDLLATEPGTPDALRAAQWIIFNTPDGPDVDQAAAVIVKNHIRDANLVYLSEQLERMRPSCSTILLQAMMTKNPHPVVQGNACYTLAVLSKASADYGKNKKATAEATKLFERVISDFGDVNRNGARLADLAKPELYELQHLLIGMPAPQTRGEDLDGQPLDLGDYRGKVVVLYFWSAGCAYPDDVEPLRKLQDRMAGQPFAILGVHADDNTAKAKAVAKKCEMSWPSFRDARQGPIATAWNIKGWPTIYVLDRNGIICYRGFRADGLLKPVESLVRQ